MFKDYYSILGISYPSSDDEIRQAHYSKVESLGTDSSNYSNPNYQQRVDVEEAFRVLGVSYSLKKAYDEEYLKYMKSEDKDAFCIQDDWTLSQINSEHNFVVNRLLQPLPTIEEVQKKGWGGKALGCVGKIFGFFHLMLAIAGAKKCSREQMKNALSDSSYNTEYISSPSSASPIFNYQVGSSSNAERKLQKTAKEINQSLPRIIDDNITLNAISLTFSALVYEYVIEDDFFELYKYPTLSLNGQLDNIRASYSDMKPMIDLLLETHRGISYKYICKRSGEINIVEVPYSKLAEI